MLGILWNIRSYVTNMAFIAGVKCLLFHSQFLDIFHISQYKHTMCTYALKILSFWYKTMWFYTHYNAFFYVRTRQKHLKEATQHSSQVSVLSLIHTKHSHIKAFSLGAMQSLVFCPRMLRLDASDSKCILENQSKKGGSVSLRSHQCACVCLCE